MTTTAGKGRPISSRARTTLERVHAALSGGQVRDVRMFGAVAVMLDGAMAVAVHQDGSLLVRVDPELDAELVTRPGAERATVGTDRSMGPGWIHVQAAVVDRDDALASWLEHATTYLHQRHR